MNSPVRLQEQVELLEQLFSAATHEASAAMCRWTNGLISLSLDEVRRLPLESVCEELEIGDELLTMVVLSLQGSLGGDLLLSFDEANGRQLAAALLGREVETSPEWTELERSALCETGNILGCAYMNAVTRLIGSELVPSPPCFVQDYGASVLQQALLMQAESGDDIVLCRTRFERAGKRLNWHVIFVPSSQLRARLEGALAGVEV